MTTKPGHAKRVRAERLAAGLCAACGKCPHDPHNTNCRPCADRATRRQLAYLKRSGRKR